MFNSLEVSLANLSFLTLFISMLSYWIQTATFETNPKLSLVSSNQALKDLPLSLVENSDLLKNNKIMSGEDMNSLQTQSVGLGLAINTDTDISFSLKNFFLKGFKNLGTFLMLISNVSIFLVLSLRWKESGHFPLSNLYESLMFLSWSLTFIHLFIELILLNSNKNNFFLNLLNIFKFFNFNEVSGSVNKLPFIQKNFFITKLIGSITSPCALFTNAFASFSLPKEMQEASPLVPALQSNWLMMHVTVMILSYAALILGSLLSIGFLIITKGKEMNFNNFENSAIAVDTTGTNKNSFSLSLILDNLSYRILGIGFPLLTIGILSGAVWANEAWGSYWSWDPKETWAFLTWLVFAIYLHTRLTKGWKGKKPALIASLGFVTVWICYLGVNLIGEGLHSYGWLS